MKSVTDNIFCNDTVVTKIDIRVTKFKLKSTKFVHRCVICTMVNKGKESPGLWKGIKKLRKFESCEKV